MSKKKEVKKTDFSSYFEFYNNFLDSKIGQTLQLRKLSEKIVYEGAKNGVKAGAAATKVFQIFGSGKAKRLEPKKTKDLFDLNYNEEQLMIQESIKQLADKIRIHAEKDDYNGKISEEILREYNELQLAFMQIPEELGGIMKEKSTTTQMMMVETLAYGDLSQAFALFSANSVINAIVQWGTDSQQQILLKDFVEDNAPKAAIAINEPTALFSPLTLKTKANKDGNQYVINGEKNMVAYAESAQYFLVAAQSEGGKNQLFFVDRTTDGVSTSADVSMGLKTAELGKVVLDNVRVDESAMLGGSKGINYQEFINYSKLGWCSLAVGCSQAVLDYVITYANDRYAFGEPISNRQAVAFMIADIKIELDS
ncbi:MAG: acyl-CoA/acyl-ACP dehydrogenase, partial [Bacteroidetes bacterium]|nr:acyl-CoA/acyl-ACP dehydrogenase [Bacteroidota bacterium]